MKKAVTVILLFLAGSLCVQQAQAQQSRYYQRVTRIVTDAGDTATLIILRPIYCFPKRTFKSKKEKLLAYDYVKRKHNRSCQTCRNVGGYLVRRH